MQASSVFAGLESHFLQAQRLGFPAFIGSIEQSTPLNATPYVVSMAQFDAIDWPLDRRPLLDALKTAVAQLPDNGLRAELILVGGSFLDPRLSPHDLDCALFYSRDTDCTVNLNLLQEQLRTTGLDIRLLPLDIEPVMVLKMALFFGVLYTRGRGAQPQLRGLVLIDCCSQR